MWGDLPEARLCKRRMRGIKAIRVHRICSGVKNELSVKKALFIPAGFEEGEGVISVYLGLDLFCPCIL